MIEAQSRLAGGGWRNWKASLAERLPSGEYNQAHLSVKGVIGSVIFTMLSVTKGYSRIEGRSCHRPLVITV